jgi:transcriptional regulator with XRE-family HTH domain
MARKLKKELPNLGKLLVNKIGAKIAQIRTEKGLTQKELADKLGIQRSLISDYEQGRIRIYDGMIARIAIALNVSTDELLGLKKNINRHLPSLKLMKRLYEIEELTASEQKALLKNIDMFIEASKKRKVT